MRILLAEDLGRLRGRGVPPRMRDARRNDDSLACVNLALLTVQAHPQRAGHNLEPLLLLGVKVLGGDKPSGVDDKAHPEHVAVVGEERDVLAGLRVVDRVRHGCQNLRQLPASEFVTAACMSYLANERRLRWAYAGHPPALWLWDGQELAAPRQGPPLGLEEEFDYVEGSLRATGLAGVLLYTDGLTEARRSEAFFGLERVSGVLAELEDPSPSEAIAILRASFAGFAYGPHDAPPGSGSAR